MARRLCGRATLGAGSTCAIRLLPQEFLDELELLDCTEVIQIVRRPDESLDLDLGNVDPDTAIALLAKTLVRLVISEVIDFEEDEEEEEDEDADGD